MEIIYDIKTLRIYQVDTYYRVPAVGIGRRAVETKARYVRIDYNRLCEHLDESFTNHDTNHPFSNVLKNRYNLGGFHPLIFRAFGEVNPECISLLKLCAKFSAARKGNAYIAPPPK